MRRSLLAICASGIVLCALTAAQAGTINLIPSPADLQDLDHYYYYDWGISGYTIPLGEDIAAATLSINSINNWAVEPNILYIHLLDTPPTNGIKIGADTWRWSDNQNGGDAWAGNGALLTTYTDDDVYPNPPENWSYTFSRQQVITLNEFAGDGVFGLGFDPDCHYYNSGITLTLTTEKAPVTEPGSLLAFAAGLTSLVGMVVKRMSEA